MKKYVAVAALCMAGVLIASWSGLSYAQDDTAMELPAVETEYTTGTVSSVDEAASELAIKEYDYNQDQEVETTYTVNPQTTFQNAAALKDIAAGDTVEIEYVATDGKKVAKVISVQKPVVEEAPKAEDATGAGTTAVPEPASAATEQPEN